MFNLSSRQPDGGSNPIWGNYMEQRVADPGPLGLAGFAMTTFC